MFSVVRAAKNRNPSIFEWIHLFLETYWFRASVVQNGWLAGCGVVVFRGGGQGESKAEAGALGNLIMSSSSLQRHLVLAPRMPMPGHLSRTSYLDTWDHSLITTLLAIRYFVWNQAECTV